MDRPAGHVRATLLVLFCTLALAFSLPEPAAQESQTSSGSQGAQGSPGTETSQGAQGSPGSQESLLKKGEDLYLNNKPEEAVAVLKQAVRQHPDNARVYHYMGISYQQLGRHEDAIDSMSQALSLPMSSSLKASLYYNIANSYSALGDHDEAQKMYTKAVEVNGSLANAYLNRANSTVAAYKDTQDREQQVKAFENAVEDYRVYLNLKPTSTQKQAIERMIALLQGEARETRRAIAQERRRREEAERRRKELLDSVLNSLDEAGKETESMSAGQEDIEDYEDTIDIED